MATMIKCEYCGWTPSNDTSSRTEYAKPLEHLEAHIASQHPAGSFSFNQLTISAGCMEKTLERMKQK